MSLSEGGGKEMMRVFEGCWRDWNNNK